MKTDMERQEIDLINKICLFFHRPYICTNNWEEYIFSETYEKDRPLKTKSAILILTSLLDVISSHNKKVKALKSEAVRLNYNYLVRYCEQATEFKNSILEIFWLYTKEEQIFMQDYRNQIVHGYLNGQNEKRFRVSFVSNNGNVEVNTISANEYREIISEVHNRGLFGDIALELVNRFANKDLQYWKIWSEYSNIHSDLYQSMQCRKEFEWATIKA